MKADTYSRVCLCFFGWLSIDGWLNQQSPSLTTWTVNWACLEGQMCNKCFSVASAAYTRRWTDWPVVNQAHANMMPFYFSQMTGWLCACVCVFSVVQHTAWHTAEQMLIQQAWPSRQTDSYCEHSQPQCTYTKTCSLHTRSSTSLPPIAITSTCTHSDTNKPRVCVTCPAPDLSYKDKVALCQPHGRPVYMWVHACALSRSGRCFFCLRDSSAYPDNSPEQTVALKTISKPISPVNCGLLPCHVVKTST